MKNYDDPTVRKQLYSEPKLAMSRSYLVGYIQHLIAQAMTLSPEQLYGAAGHGIAMEMCGVLAWQSSTDTEGEQWLTDEQEPDLLAVLDAVTPLDADAANPASWDRLFKAVEQLTDRSSCQG